jgi:hypothetical protein
MGKQHSLDAMTFVPGQRLLIPLDRSSLAPFGIEDLDLEAETLRHVDPEMAEHAETRRQYLVTR